MADEGRRYVIEYLQQEATPVAMDDLARQTADWKAKQSPTEPPDLQGAVYRSLYHCHIPKLADSAVVTHNRDRHAVEPAVNFPHITEVWNVVSDVRDLEVKYRYAATVQQTISINQQIGLRDETTISARPKIRFT